MPHRITDEPQLRTPDPEGPVKTIFAHTDPNDVAAQWDQVAATFADSFPKVTAMLEDIRMHAREWGWVETVMGRRRWLPGLKSSASAN